MKFALADGRIKDMSFNDMYVCMGECRYDISKDDKPICEIERNPVRRFYTWPTHDEHDMLVNNVDNRNTRMIHNFVNMGFNIEDVGKTYFYHKWHYFPFDKQYMFHPLMDGLRQILETSRIFAVNMFAYSKNLSMYNCDFKWLYIHSHRIYDEMLDAYRELGIKHKDAYRFLNSFISQLKDRSLERDSWAGKRLPIDRKDFDLVDSLDFIVKKEPKSVSLHNMRWGVIGSLRLFCVDLPCMMFEAVRMRVAETREDGCYSDLDEDEWEGEPTYADIVIDEALLYAPRSV